MRRFPLWRGPPLLEFADRRFARAELARLDDLRLACLEERIEQDLGAGRHAEVTGELEALVAEQPLRERLRCQLMLALYRCGRQAEALDAYQSARRVLVDELGIEPGRELRELHQRILTQDPALDLRAGPAAAGPAGDDLRMLSGECRRVLSLRPCSGRSSGSSRSSGSRTTRASTGCSRCSTRRSRLGSSSRFPARSAGCASSMPLTRETLYDEIPAAHRARLHRRVAEVLEALYATNLEPHRAEVAHHLALSEQG